MKKNIILFSMALLVACGTQNDKAQNWTHYVRIAGHGLSLSTVDSIIKDAKDTHLFGFEVDNSLTGYYESFLDPTDKLKAIKALADSTHKIGNYAFVYTEGLETITAECDKKEHTFFKDHPDWVQRDITDRPAVFGGGTAFWISEGDEDVWISPFATEWRKIYMERIRQIAATGIDGIFIDIPYWMTHFDGWEDTWASFDDYTVAAFKDLTGLDAKTDIKLGDFADPGFIKWVDFRMAALTDFMKDVNANAKSVNPKCMVIAEIYPGIDESAVRVGADVYQMYQVVDAIGHEYSGGGGNAASKNPLDWMSRMTGLYTFCAFAEGKATWMLSYSWSQRQENIVPGEAIKNLMLSNVMAGANCWDAAGHVMSGSNDIETRKTVFKWIAEHEQTFYKPRKTIKPIGVYFSDKTRNYFADDFIASYQGIMYLLLQSHLEFEIVTPRTLSKFCGELLILPDVKCVSDEEMNNFSQYVSNGNVLYITAESGTNDPSRKLRSENPLHKLLGIDASARKLSLTSANRFVYNPVCPGKAYFDETEKQYNEFGWTGSVQGATFESMRQQFVRELTNEVGYKPAVMVNASPFVSSQTAVVDGKTHVFIANFKGLKKNEIAVQLSENNVTIEFQASQNASVFGLPFLGQVEKIQTTWESGNLKCTIPEIGKGMVVWVEE
ncbi:hypothetical protein JW960_05600 [candidate division KSB1 bacterium]|nr:hypothetical protein [candidate division KSB1 bacterium]